jgi:hypothetical protein
LTARALQARENLALARLFALQLARIQWRLPCAEPMAELREPEAERKELRAAKFEARAERKDLRARYAGRAVGAKKWGARLLVLRESGGLWRARLCGESEGLGGLLV